MRQISYLPLLMMLSVAACASPGNRSDAVSPDVSLPEAYAYAQQDLARIAADEAWWSSFDDPVLDRLIEKAQASNKSLEAGLANIRSARAAVAVADADLLPQLSGSLSGSADSDSGFDTLSGSGRLSASYELDLFGSVEASREAARASLASTEFAQRALELSVASDVATNYFNLQVTRAQLGVAQENLTTAERIYEIVKARYKAGTISGFDVSSQEATLANARARIPQLEAQIVSLETAIAILAGESPEAFQVETVDLYSVALPEPGTGLPSELLTRRPDLLQAEAELAGAEANIDAARAAFLPSVDLAAGVSAMLTGGADATSTISAALSQSIFSGGRLQGQLDSAVARRDALIADYENTILSALRDVEIALKTQSTAEAREAELEIALSASEKALEAAELRYRVGTDDLTSLLTAQQSLYTASENSLDARLSRLTAAIDLYVALGGGY